MSGFRNPIIGGGGALIYPGIHSPGYLPATSGWTINKDGSAEFSGLTLRGTFVGTNYVINSSGLFFYSGAPALGNLIASISNVNGTDAPGNAWLAGIAAYGTRSGTFVAVVLTGPQLQWWTSSGAAGPWSEAVLVDLLASLELQVANGSTFQVLGGGLHIATAGFGISIKEGANARMGTAVLAGGTITIANTTITAATRINAFVQVLGGTAGILRVAGRVVGTSFTISSSSAMETSTIFWELKEPG
jgi:hypothetical protein